MKDVICLESITFFSVSDPSFVRMMTFEVHSNFIYVKGNTKHPHRVEKVHGNDLIYNSFGPNKNRHHKHFKEFLAQEKPYWTYT